MRTFFHGVLTLAWGLWIGALATIFVVATSNFHAFDRQTAGTVNAAMFLAVEKWLLIVAAAALAGAVGLVLRVRTRLRTLVLALLVLAAVGILLSNLWITPSITRMFAEGQTATPAFGRMHGLSMMSYTVQTAILTIVGLLLSPIRSDPPRIPATAGTTPAASAG